MDRACFHSRAALCSRGCTLAIRLARAREPPREPRDHLQDRLFPTRGAWHDAARAGCMERKHYSLADLAGLAAVLSLGAPAQGTSAPRPRPPPAALLGPGVQREPESYRCVLRDRLRGARRTLTSPIPATCGSACIIQSAFDQGVCRRAKATPTASQAVNWYAVRERGGTGADLNGELIRRTGSRWW